MCLVSGYSVLLCHKIGDFISNVGVFCIQCMGLLWHRIGCFISHLGELCIQCVGQLATLAQDILVHSIVRCILYTVCVTAANLSQDRVVYFRFKCIMYTVRGIAGSFGTE